MEYESITDFLFEGNSPDVLTEEQRYDFLLEYFEEEYLEDLNEEELGELYELVEGIVMKAIGGLAKKGLTAAKDRAVGAAKSAVSAADAARKSATDAAKRGIKKAGAATLRGAGKAANIATLGTARAGIKAGRKVAGAVKRTVGAEIERQASQARSAPGRKADKKHLAAYDKFKAKQAEKAARSKRFQSSRLGRAIRHFGTGVMGKEEPRPVADDYSPSKNEFYNRVYGIVQETVLDEGKTTGGDPFATGARVQRGAEAAKKKGKKSIEDTERQVRRIRAKVATPKEKRSLAKFDHADMRKRKGKFWKGQLSVMSREEKRKKAEKNKRDIKAVADRPPAS